MVSPSAQGEAESLMVAYICDYSNLLQDYVKKNFCIVMIDFFFWFYVPEPQRVLKEYSQKRNSLTRHLPGGAGVS